MRSLYWKICVTFLIVVGVSLGAGRFVFHATMSRHMRGPRPHPMDMGRSMAQFVSWGIERYGHEGLTLSQAAQRVQLALGDRHLAIVVFDANRQPISGENLPPHFGPPGHEPALVPVQVGPERGFVACGMRPPGPPEDFWKVVLQTAGAAITTVFVVAALLGLIVFRLLTRRLDQLQRCVAGIADGELDLRVGQPGPDEIGDLGRSLNRMAERLQRVVGELNENDKRRRELLADISHELKTPLTVLRGHLEELLDAPPGEADRKSASIAFEESDRLALLIDDLLELARMQSSEFRLNRKEVILQRVVAKAVDRFQMAAANRQIQLLTRFSDEPLRMMLDHRRIEQVVANLVQNALKHVEAGGQIEVGVEIAGEGAQITVSDNGRGMAPEDLEAAFDRFKTGSVDHGSTGLGLSIVKQLVEAHGGTVRLECRAEGGVRAVVVI